MAYKITGRVLHVSTPQSFTSKSGNQFVKRDIVIMVRRFDPNTGEPSFDEYNTPKFSFMNEKCQQLDQIKEGTIVTISFDVRGRTYEKDGKTEYLTDLNPFSIIPDKFQQEVYQHMGYSQNQQPVTQPYQQPMAPQLQQAYTKPPQQSYSGQQYPTSPAGGNMDPQPKNCWSIPDDDMPF